jgi:hypothetical protein
MFRKIQIWTDKKLADTDKLLLKEEGTDSKKWLINDRLFNIDHWNDLQLEKLFIFLENHGYKNRIASDFIAYDRSRNCICENGMMSFIDLHNIFFENAIHTLLKDFSETSERFYPNCGAYIMSRRMALVLIDAGIEPMKNVYYWPAKFLPSR